MSYMDGLMDKAEKLKKRPVKEVVILRETVAWELAQLENEIELETKHQVPDYTRLPQLRRRATRLRTALAGTGGAP